MFKRGLVSCFVSVGEYSVDERKIYWSNLTVLYDQAQQPNIRRMGLKLEEVKAICL